MQKIKFLSLLFIALFAVSMKSTAQLSVIFKDKTAYLAVEVDSAGKIKLDSVPRTITLNFPGEDPQSFILKFNKDTAVFKVGFGCSGDSCIKLQLNDVSDNKIKLTFNEKGELVAINTRYIKPRKVLLDKNNKPHIVIEGGIKTELTDKKKPADIYDALSIGDSKKQQIALSVDSQIVADYTFYCGSLNCKDCHVKKDSPRIRKPCPTNFFECEEEYDLYGKVFDKNSTFYKKLSSNKATPKYWVVYDNRDGKNIIPYYFKIHNNRSGKNRLTLKTSIAPVAGKHVAYSILGPADSSYTVNNSTAQYYEESEPKVSTVLNGVIQGDSQSPSGDSTPVKQDSLPKETVALADALKEFKDISPELLAGYRSSASLDFKYDFFNKNLLQTTGLFFSSEMRAFSKKDSMTSNSMNELLDKYIEALRDIRNLEKENENLILKVNSLRKRVKSNENEIKELKKQVEEKNKVISSLQTLLIKCDEKIAELNKIVASYLPAKHLIEKLYALERDLEKFNAEYEDISFVEKQYKLDLVCMKLKIKAGLNATSVDDAKGLASDLINKVKANKADSVFYVEFATVIKNIENNFNTAISKKPKFSIFSVSKKISNTDEVISSLKTSKNSTPFYIDTFKTSWGLKIDFSTGVFINGLSNPSFVLSQHNYRYKERRDTINSAGVLVPIYTGVIRDTAGNLIQTNEPKISYSAGFVVHVYPRTGGFVNGGLITGITINNNNSSPIQLMLGGSIMFNASKSSRVSIVGGITWGQVTELSTVAVPFKWNPDADPDNKLYDSRTDIPKFYSGSSDLSTFNKWKHSWFFGITYNFASLNVGK